MGVRLSALRAGRPPFICRKIPGTHFSYRQSRPQGHSAAARITSIEKANDLIGNRTRDLQACNTVLQQTTLPRVPFKMILIEFNPFIETALLNKTAWLTCFQMQRLRYLSKAKLSLSLIHYGANKLKCWVAPQLHGFLAPVLHEDKGWDSCPGRCTPREREIHDTRRIGGWIDTRDDLVAVKKTKIPCPCRESSPDSFVVRPIT
jgi:hypothetical protein